MRPPVKRTRYSPVLKVAIGLAVAGGGCVVTSGAVAFLVADHSSSDSSTSSLISIGLVAVGFLTLILAGVLLAGETLARWWRSHRARRLPG